MRKPYASLGSRCQVDRVRPVAIEACRHFGLKDFALRLVNHGFNTTFRVDAHGRTFALRLNVNSVHTTEELSAEVAWTTALSQRTDVKVPKPHPTRDGKRFATLDWSEIDRPLNAVLYSWLPGRVGFRCPTPLVAKGLGMSMAALHRHATSWTEPEASCLQPLTSILFGKPLRLIERRYDGDLDVFKEVENRANGVLKRLRQQNPIPIHSDLHLGNVMVHKGSVAIFDFDDSMLGWPIVDVATSLFYLRRNPNGDELETAFWEGLGQPRDAVGSDEDREALTAGRALMLCNELFDMNTAEFVALAPKYAVVTETRLAHYLKTGRLDPNVASTD